MQKTAAPLDAFLKGNPLRIIDIGAADGIHPRWNAMTSYLHATLFEPDPNAFSRLKPADNVTVLSTGLSDARKKMNLYLCKKPLVSSVYKPKFEFIKRFPDPERFEITETLEIDVDTLDHQKIEDPDFIKIDVQGHELPILEGGVQMLERVIGVETEVEFTPFYEGQPTFADLDPFMRKNGFELSHFGRLNFWKENGGMGQLMWTDALYFKHPAAVMKYADTKKIVRAMVLYMHHRRIDLARLLLHLAKDRVGDDFEELERELSRFERMERRRDIGRALRSYLYRFTKIKL